ncbi:hypothetical protein KC19_VG092100 [Ceratodon purpureus]|uniref:Uncharacterized protein n=1 Tax=Ceratodon purpureus TaxID=3225 RepID=A0A8T0HNH4_CERPU|nr:hypothetical protein KC19_VG092100 [Ceratodon purpureus]
MPKRRLSCYCRRLNLWTTLIRVTIAKVDRVLSRYDYKDLHLAGVIVKDCQNVEDADMILEEVWGHHVEREARIENHTTDGVRKIHNSAITAFLDATVQYVGTWQQQCRESS